MFLACSPLFGPMDVHSPSGHVAAATVVAGGLAVMLSNRRNSILPAALLAAIVIGVSRLVLGMHSLPEVIVGALIGLAGAAALLRFAGTPPRLKIAPLMAVIVVVAAMFHGLHLPAEAAIRHTAFRAAQFIPVCRGTPELHIQRIRSWFQLHKAPEPRQRQPGIASTAFTHLRAGRYHALHDVDDSPEHPESCALVTGGAQRLGQAIALELGACGFDIAIHCNTSIAKAQETQARIAATWPASCCPAG